MSRTKVYVIHPGTQYAYRLANAISSNKSIKKTILLTWFTISKEHFLARFKIFRKRVKDVSENVLVCNSPVFEVFLTINLKVNQFLKINNNNAYYFWQSFYGCLLLPVLYINRKTSIIFIFETCGWPLTKYAKKWNIPIVMDFPSISHERALELSIDESYYGKKIKTLERQYIDFSLNCSNFALETYKGKTSAKLSFPVSLGSDFKLKDNQEPSISYDNRKVHICCLANTEFRKGLDLLIKAFDQIEIPDKKLYLIGHIDSDWVDKFTKEQKISLSNIILTGPKAQQDLQRFLIEKRIDLHILPSRFDSFGMVVPETMALGIPNIVSPFVGAGEKIDHKKNGFLLEKLDVAELVNQIHYFCRLTIEKREILTKDVIKKSKEMSWNAYSINLNRALVEILSSIDN